MKRFIDIGTQLYLNENQPKQFAFYCTVKDTFERFNDEDLWETAIEFEKDYLEHGGKELKRYLDLIPDEFKTKNITH